MEHAVLNDLVPAIPRSAYTTWAPTAADRLDWHRRITALNTAAARHGLTRDNAQHVLLGLMDTAEWHTRIWTLDDLFDTVHGTLRLLAPEPEPAAIKPAADVTAFGDAIRHAVRRMRDSRFQVWPAALPEPRPMATAWARFVHAHPERPGLRTRDA